MSKFLLQRLLIAIPTLLVVTFVVFMIVHLIPGDPAQILAGDTATAAQIPELRAEWGLDQPLLVQYATYMQNLLQGNMGRSIASRQPVAWEISERYPSTLTLALCAIVVATTLGLGLRNHRRHAPVHAMGLWQHGLVAGRHLHPHLLVRPHYDFDLLGLSGRAAIGRHGHTHALDPAGREPGLFRCRRHCPADAFRPA